MVETFIWCSKGYKYLPIPSLSVFRTVKDVVPSPLLRKKFSCKHIIRKSKYTKILVRKVYQCATQRQVITSQTETL